MKMKNQLSAHYQLYHCTKMYQMYEARVHETALQIKEGKISHVYGLGTETNYLRDTTEQVRLVYNSSLIPSADLSSLFGR